MSDHSISYLDSAVPYTTSTLIAALIKSKDIVCLYDSGVIAKPDPDWLKSKLNEADIIHNGPTVHGSTPLNNVQLCTFNWNFINPSPSENAVSWKPSLQFVAFQKTLYEHLDGLDPSFQSPAYALIDFAYRTMVSGGLPVNDSSFAGVFQPFTANDHDEARFVLKHLNKKSFEFYRFCLLVSGAKWIARPSGVTAWSRKDLEFSFRLLDGIRKNKVGPYSAIIPTINRYDYIGKSIESLLRLSFAPTEIIVVDQSPIQKRNDAVYRSFESSGKLKVIYLDTPGQSTARNAALNICTQDWVLLFEDDAEAWPEMVNEHVLLLNRSGADVSTGVVVSPGSDENFISPANRRYCLSDILTTGNAFLARQTALSVGGFDPAFDRGSGADDDFGKRLYLIGKKIVYNYKSIETHYKAPTGGMREHGAWWRNHSTLWGPYPPATQVYAIRKYYAKKYRAFLVLSLILKAKKRYSWPSYLLLLLLLPVKLTKSWNEANRLKKKV